MALRRGTKLSGECLFIIYYVEQLMLLFKNQYCCTPYSSYLCLLYTDLSSNKISLHLSDIGGSFDQGHPYDGGLLDKVRPRHPCGSGQAPHPTAPSGVAKEDAHGSPDDVTTGTVLES